MGHEYLKLLENSNETQFLWDSAHQFVRDSGCDECDILAREPSGTLVLRASTWSPEHAEHLRVAPSVGLIGKCFTTRSLVFAKDKASEKEEFRVFSGFDESGFRAALIIPVLSLEEPFGVVYLRNRERWDLSADQQAALKQMVDNWGLMWQAFASGYKAGTSLKGLGYLSEVSQTLSQSPYLEEILQLLVQLTARRFEYRVVTIRIHDESSQELILRATQATHKAYIKKRSIKLTESIAGQAIRSGKPVVVEDVLAEPEYIGHDLAEEQGLKSMVCIPLMVQDRPVGVMSCYTSEIRSFPKEEIAMLEASAKQAAISIEHAKLQVRNTLMQEMHHRVKNNLQQIASLLRLQVRQSHYKSLEEAITDSLQRIEAIAEVHELLSRDDLDRVAIKGIAENLAAHQERSFILPNKEIQFKIAGDPVFLNTTQATQVALILNEMIQNAVEHGFKDSDAGEIHVTVEDLGDGIGIWVTNNGDPVPHGFDPAEGGRLGLQIIRSLVSSLGGHLVISNHEGWTVCELKFPKSLVD